MSEKKTIKVEIERSVAGKFLLPYSAKEKVEIEESLAQTLIKQGYAKKTR